MRLLFVLLAAGVIKDSQSLAFMTLLGNKSLSRRDCFITSSTYFLSVSTASRASAVTAPTGNENNPIFVQGTVTLPAEAVIDSAASALYVTCRPDRVDNIPKAILDGSRGKAPPVLSARFENPSFPFEFELTTANLTPEGASGDWWQQQSSDLVVSARWDDDGVAATRSPNDLVGRAIQHETNRVIIALQGRGAFGKFATQKKPAS